MNAIPPIELSIAVPKDTVASFLRNRPYDRRVIAATQLLEEQSGNSTRAISEVDDTTIEETMMHNGWFGKTAVTYRYSLNAIGSSETHVLIQTHYDLPWILRSILSWPLGHIIANVIASYATTTTVSDLVALECGLMSRMLLPAENAVS